MFNRKLARIRSNKDTWEKVKKQRERYYIYAEAVGEMRKRIKQLKYQLDEKDKDAEALRKHIIKLLDQNEIMTMRIRLLRRKLKKLGYTGR